MRSLKSSSNLEVALFISICSFPVVISVGFCASHRRRSGLRQLHRSWSEVIDLDFHYLSKMLRRWVEGLLLNYLDISTEGKLSIDMNNVLKPTSFAEHAYALRVPN